MKLREADVVFVIDEDAGPHVAKGIVDAGGRAVLVTEKAYRGVKDREWIPMACQWGSAIITRDRAMKTNPAETAALIASQCHAFMLRGNHLPFDQLYALAKERYVGMLRYVLKYNTPFLAHVSKNGIDVKHEAGRRGGPKPT